MPASNGLLTRLAPWLAVLAAVAALRLRADAAAHLEATTHYEDIYYLPPPTALRVAVLGFDDAAADLLWIRALIYMGDEYMQGRGLQHVFSYTEALLALDPDFRAVYHWIATAGTYQPEAGDLTEIQATLAFIERGVERFPDDGELEWDLGATLAFELPAYLETDEEREAARADAVEHLIRASRLGAAPPWMMLSNASLLDRLGRTERAVEHLEEMYATVDDPSLRAQIADHIAALRSDAHADAFVAASDDAEDARLHTYPWMHPAMYFLVGPRPAVDVDATLRDGFGAHAFEETDTLADAFLETPATTETDVAPEVTPGVVAPETELAPEPSVAPETEGGASEPASP